MADRTKPKTDEVGELELPIEHFLTYRLLTLTNHLNRQAMHILETQASLRLPEWRCLAFIHQCSCARGKASLHEVAEETAMDRGLVTRSVQGLVSKGHVLTERDSKDRRVVHAALTRQGYELFQRMLPVMRERQMHLLNALSPHDRKSVYRILERLNTAAEEYDYENLRQ
ncbi:MAG: MarR family winged helix-turn-helix transcriptional regulator [Pseudomonadota bacterium]